MSMYKKIKEYIKIRYLLYILLFVLVFYGIYGICYQYMLSKKLESYFTSLKARNSKHKILEATISLF